MFGDSYKWLLYGDDDTMWFIEGVLKYVQTLDHDLPYFVTGGLASMLMMTMRCLDGQLHLHSAHTGAGQGVTSRCSGG